MASFPARFVATSMVALLFLASVGCGQQSSRSPSSVSSADNSMVAVDEAGAMPSTSDDPPSSAQGQDSVTARRRIVYRADVELAVEHFDPVPQRIESIVQSHDGFVSDSTLSGSPGQPRSGHWTIRIPVARYSDFLAAVRELGEVRRVRSTSDDITAEFYDTEARIRNKQVEEQRLQKLLTDATGELEEVLAVERELSRVRGEIEQAQGRLRVMKDLTELTTVSVAVTEIKNYTPQQAANFATRVRRTWQHSIAGMVVTAQSVALLAVALVPWLPLPLLMGLALLFVRRLGRR